MADNVKINSTLVSGRKDKTLTYAKYVMDEISQKGLDEILSDVRYKSIPITTRDIENNAVTITKIAQEVWDKIKAEYLSTNGNNHMNANLEMNGNAIIDVNEIKSQYPYLKIKFHQDNHDILFGIDEPSEHNGYSFVPFLIVDTDKTKTISTIEASGYLTNDRSNLGLLSNDGSVTTAMTDTDVDGVLNSVFNS